MTKTSEILPIKKKVGRPAKNLNGKTVRQIVLDEARKLVSQHGTDSLSFDRLSKETGIAKGTILYQFKRKERPSAGSITSPCIRARSKI